MIHPTRTNLLLLKDKAHSVANGIAILKARRQALIREFLNTTKPFLRSRENIQANYGRAISELTISREREGREGIESIALVTQRDMGMEIIKRSIWGLKYRDVLTHESPLRSPAERGYDYTSTTPHLEECISGFEKILDAMLELASFESKLKRLGAEILLMTRKIRVLEERVFPDLKVKIRAIAQYIGEREREGHYRLKKFKEL
ncbi:MAG: V-type ATP synthase subunit D [Deltaproteobacteria bacterium]|nr:V-type ATP synthase subunit D [Deltaproteobacteria bacterium]